MEGRLCGHIQAGNTVWYVHTASLLYLQELVNRGICLDPEDNHIQVVVKVEVGF